MRKPLTALAVALAGVVLAAPSALAQSLQKDNGHCANASGRAVLACWNFEAGGGMPEQLADYSEFLPFLTGWDFRINLPHVRFQQAGVGSGSPAALVGVVEDATAPTNASGTLNLYGHRNNSLWILRVSAVDRRLYVKQLPSRRNPNGGSTENVASLTGGWSELGTAQLRLEKPAAVVLGEGLGAATLFVAARRDPDNVLLFARRTISSTSASPSGAWEPLGITSAGRPALAPAFDGRVALAWRDPTTATVKVRLYTPSTSSWGPTVEVPGSQTEGDPQLVWDGAALDLFFIAQSGRLLRHTYATGPELVFRDQVDVSTIPVRLSSFHALAWNGRLHVALVPDQGAAVIQYAVSRTAFGTASHWVAPAPVGFASDVAPKLAAFSDNLFVVGVSGGKVRYARRDANRRGPEATGSPDAGIWLAPGQAVDPGAAGSFAGDVEPFPWNGDVYLAANVGVTGEPGYRLRLVNLSRAAFKQLVTGKWGIRLRWGALGGAALRDAADAPIAFAKGEEIPMLGDFDGDGDSDLVKFTQRREPGAGPAPVYVARNPGWTSERWHTFFALKGEIPLVGDFNGDGRDDIVTFVQKEQRYANGSPIGPAPVWVALSDGTRFQTSRVWHRFFALKGEIPLVGDFNGDGRDDIVTFVQKLQRKADGSVLGQAPVWVALSDGSRFQPSRVWHTFFSLKGEVPLVGDFNLDGRDDIVTFLHDRVSGERARNVFAALSQGGSFSRSFTWMSDFAGNNEIPAVGLGGRVNQITGRAQDADKRTADLFAFRRTDGAVHFAPSMGNVPYPSGAPWERYKWFLDKGLGVAMFPEWIWQRPNHCIGVPHSFVLLGLAGSGGETVTNLSVRFGSRHGHVIEELGHSTFANCFRNPSDPTHAGIYTSAGIDAGNLWGGGPMSSVDCPNGTAAAIVTPVPPAISNIPYGLYDCRDDVAEHYFLSLLIHYRVDGDEFRSVIQATSDRARRGRLARQYDWIKNVWFNGAEFKRGPAVAGGLTQDGLLCLPGECPLSLVEAPEPVGVAP